MNSVTLYCDNYRAYVDQMIAITTYQGYHPEFIQCTDKHKKNVTRFSKIIGRFTGLIIISRITDSLTTELQYQRMIPRLSS